MQTSPRPLAPRLTSKSAASNPRWSRTAPVRSALDARVRKDLRRWLRHFQREIGVTTIFVTHDQEEALELADEVVVMNNAKIEQLTEMLLLPASAFIETLF